MVCDHHQHIPPGETALAVKGLSFAYGGDEILHDISVNFPAGRICGLLGPNGSGKTTLFKCCLNFLTPRKGHIDLLGKPLTSYSPYHLAQHIAYVPQEHRLTFPFTVKEMVEMGRNPHRGIRPFLSRADHEVVAHVMERVGIADLASRIYSSLSGGQRQLVLLARALAQSASLIFLDEPTSSLDFSNQLLVWETLLPIVATGVGIVICCHEPNHILWFCHDAVILKEGRVIAVGESQSVLNKTCLQELYGEHITMATVNKQPFIYFQRNSADG